MLDDAILAELKKRAALKGTDPNTVVLTPFVNHDLRRVIRTHLEALGVKTAVAEAVIGHTKGTFDGTYNLYEYYDEKLHAVQAWAKRSAQIIKDCRPCSMARTSRSSRRA
ncbi:hypothetical protein N8E89_22630 (plasmid) [Phyllobacterium sp. A18/5-2]|uniref:hypothetical protein n=1 Tax=Phyllobacterium sp. A18/5-2 TaxID=2978392 RepID=UPI0021C9C004|nr:hypothetical protein [Phyllobacterium sp. A18/5-2]UXN66033.1 hypothetical protein N8E89_22630 [Phyllobacterium sp. A18/5-2]